MLIFSTFALNGWAQDEYILNEDFSEYPSNNPNLSEFHNWKVKGCTQGMNGNWSNYALKVENYKNGNKTEIGYAITPALSYAGDVRLSFNYARGSTQRNSIIDITIQNSGTFEDGLITNSIPVTDGSQATFYSKSYNILNTTEATTIMFSEHETNNTFAIDNVKVTKIPVISLTESDNNNNDKTIEDNDENVVMVEMSRTLTGGIWNTLCLPFDVTMDDMKLALGEGQDIKMRTFSSYADKVMTFAEATAVSAGTPFLIKLSTTVVNPTFHAVTVKNTTAQTVTSNGVSFVGTYSPVPLNINGTNLFITKNNTLALPAEGMNIMNGLRAYIVVPEDFDSSGARLMMDDGETTAVSELVPSTERTHPEATYNLKGQRVKNSRRGLYVINDKLTLVK